jgi:SAM-dependent methyltransferase
MRDLLEDSRAYWDRQAQRDPLWAILSDAAKRDGKWDIGRFFQTGTSEIAFLLYELDAQQLVVRHGSALDFGCGVGRLTQALAPHFDRVVGVDVSPSMVDLATRLNQCPQTVSYVCNQVSRVEPTTSPATATDTAAVQMKSLTGVRMDVDDPGEFPMYGVPLNTVAGLIADHGATLLHIENDRSCGEDWVSYRYFVRAAGD